MKALLVYPNAPHNLGITDLGIRLASKKSYNPPLGLATIAALLPQHWDLKLVDLTFQEISERDWKERELVLLSGTIVQLRSIFEVIREAKRRGKIVAVGGPGVFHFPQKVLDAGADFVVKGEGEVTVPLFLETLRKGDAGVVIETDQVADLTISPVPRYDLIDRDAYVDMTMQFSRGCPFRCEFCDVTFMFGRAIRTKTPEQMLLELETLHELGWRRQICFVDDNFIGNPARAKAFLNRLIPWMDEHDRPFEFYTFTSVNLGNFPEVMKLMVRAGFNRVLLGIETTDKESLKNVKKFQNVAIDIDESCRRITKAGLQIVALTMFGFDNEQPQRDLRVIDFVKRNNIPEIDTSLLQAVPGTRLWERLEREGRLLPIEFHRISDWNNVTMNFMPTRPMDEIFAEFVNVYQELYNPDAYFERTFAHFQAMDPPPVRPKFRIPSPSELRVFFIMILRHGLLFPWRRTFWKVFIKAIRHLEPGRFEAFVRACITLEHYLALRDSLAQQLKRIHQQGTKEPKGKLSALSLSSEANHTEKYHILRESSHKNPRMSQTSAAL